MLIARFGPTTAWQGNSITWDGGRFVLEGHGPVTPQDVMDYDRQGHLIWVNDGARAWVGSKLKSSTPGPRGSRRTEAGARLMARLRRSADRPAAPADEAPAENRLAKLILLLAIGALVVANALLVLALLGVVRFP